MQGITPRASVATAAVAAVAGEARTGNAGRLCTKMLLLPVLALLSLRAAALPRLERPQAASMSRMVGFVCAQRGPARGRIVRGRILGVRREPTETTRTREYRQLTAPEQARVEDTRLSSDSPTGLFSSRATRRQQLMAGVLATLSVALVTESVSAAPIRIDSEVWVPLEDYLGSKKYEQVTYSPKFTAYLARLLLNYDYASLNWWESRTTSNPSSAQRIARLLATNGFEAMFREVDANGDQQISKEEFLTALNDPETSRMREQELFAQFQASVNLGLRRFQGAEGVSRLFSLLQEDFGADRIGKRQLALLFSLMDNLQPVDAIKKLIGEVDNASIVGFNVSYAGFGYNAETYNLAWGVSAKATVQLGPTGRLLKVVLEKPVRGFEVTPNITITAPRQGTNALAIAGMNGDALERIVLSYPGTGYTLADKISISVNINGSTEILPQARAVLEMKVVGANITYPGYGYSRELPVEVTIEKPPNLSPVATAKVSAILTDQQEAILRSWLPPANLSASLRSLLPNNLVPKYDPCLARFFVSPVEALDPNYCIYFEDEFQVVPSQKFSKYFSFLDGPKARSPIEKEKPLDASVFWRFALSGAACCSVAHGVLVPLDVVKTKMQANPIEYPTALETTSKLLQEGGYRELLLGAGATIVGYFAYGGVSFGLTEYFKRVFLEVAGPENATLYPFAILLLASMSAAVFAAATVTPFEALRIRAVTTDVEGAPSNFIGALQLLINKGETGALFASLGPAVVGELPFMMTKFAMFDAVSKGLYSLFPGAEQSVGMSLLVSLVSGMTAGVAAAVVTHPFDTLTTKVAQFAALKRTDGIWGVLKDTYADGGISGFFRGTFPRAVKSAANIALQFFLYDFLKRALLVSTDDLKLFFDVMSGLEVNSGKTP